MRKILITLGVLVAFVIGIVASWIFAGRQISLFLDRFGTIEMTSARINSIVYEGRGTGGILHVNDLALSLNDRNGPSPNIGTTKNGQLGLADGGKVFAFGPPRSEAENLSTVPPAGDDASIEIRRSVLNWPTPFEVNFMTGHSPSWKRHLYYKLRWKKTTGATLDMIWRYEQFFYGQRLILGNGGWGSGFMTREGSTGLIQVTIKE
ncbi:MAG: hypothetical protein DMF36_09230 [Verrucomicrobia bacterium]|nr:MAG: hypothetical protein AUG81_11890 [Verrucomicrobia bacterium 13_1_20CM_4_54_11]PYL37690.1 MAG: hypothetical protein DMF36_09230 [Verrucomicrobiota bacterium]